MIRQVENWLPASAFSAAAMEKCLKIPVAEWALRWFGDKKSVRIMMKHDSKGRLTDFAKAEIFRGGIATIAQSGANKRHLLQAALNVSMADKSLTPADHQLLDAFSADIVKDLSHEVSKNLKSERNIDEEKSIGLNVLIEGMEVSTIFIPTSAALLAIKEQIPRSRREENFADRIQALGRNPIAAEAILGQAEITIEDLEDLSVGDVLVLNRQCDQPIDFRVAGTSKFVASCHFEKINRQYKLTF